LFVAGLLSSSPERDVFTYYAFLLFCFLGLLGLIEILISRVELRDNEIFVRWLFSTKRYPRERVTSVSWAQGCPVSIQLEGNQWVPLPETSHGSPKVAGAVRAWINETSRMTSHPEGPPNKGIWTPPSRRK
jgi:hypothetical protein